MTTWTSEGELKPRDVTLAQAFSIVFFDFFCYGGRLVMVPENTFKRDSGVLSSKEVIFEGENYEELMLRTFFARYYYLCCTYSRLIHGEPYTDDSPHYSVFRVVFGEVLQCFIPIGDSEVMIRVTDARNIFEHEEMFRVYRVRMANAALLMIFEIPIVDEPHIAHLLNVPFENLVAYLMLPSEVGYEDVPQFVKENYQLCS